MKNQSEFARRSVSYVIEASALVRAAACPAVPGESVKAAIWRASRKAGLTAGRVTSLWYRKAHRVGAEEMDLLRAAVRRAGEQEASAYQREHEDLRRRVGALEKRLVFIAPEDRASPDADGGVSVAGSGVDCARD